MSLPSCRRRLGENEILRLAAGLERASEHPLAAAIVPAAKERGLSLAEPREFDSSRQGRHRHSRRAAGRARQHADHADLGVDARRPRQGADALRGEGATAIFVAVDGEPPASSRSPIPSRRRRPRPSRSSRAGVRIVMLTGDNRRTAEAVARKLGIDEVVAEVLPEDKQDRQPTPRRRARGRHGR